MPQDKGWRCLSSTYFYQYLFSPVFIINSLYDTYYIRNGLGIPSYLTQDEDEVKVIQQFKDNLVTSVQIIEKSPHDGIFMSSCPFHTSVFRGVTWSALRVNTTTLPKAISLWYHDKQSAVKWIYIDSEKMGDAVKSGRCNSFIPTP